MEMGLTVGGADDGALVLGLDAGDAEGDGVGCEGCEVDVVVGDGCCLGSC